MSDIIKESKMDEELLVKSWFMIVVEGNVPVKRGKGKIMQNAIEREVYYVQGNQEVQYPPLELIHFAEKQLAERIGSPRMVAVNAYRVLVNEDNLRRIDDSGEEE